jgi:hypothetical protein
MKKYLCSKWIVLSPKSLDLVRGLNLWISSRTFELNTELRNIIGAEGETNFQNETHRFYNKLAAEQFGTIVNLSGRQTVGTSVKFEC